MTGRISAHAPTRVLSMMDGSHKIWNAFVVSPNSTLNDIRSYMGGMEVQIQSLLTSVVDGDSCSASRPGLMIPGERGHARRFKLFGEQNNVCPTGIQPRTQFTMLY